MHDMEFGVLHSVKWFYGRCSDRELHLKGSLAMLIRGLQNLFVTRSYAFSTKMLERNSSLVFVPFRTLLFTYFILLIPMWLLVKTDVIILLRISFVPLVRMISFVLIVRMIIVKTCCNSCLWFSLYLLSINCWFVVISYRMAPKKVPNANPEVEEVPDRPPSPPPPPEA